MLLWHYTTMLLVLVPCRGQSYQLILQVPHSIFEGDRVILRCWGNEEEEINKMVYYKDGKELITFSRNSSLIISKADSRNNGMYSCSASGEDYTSSWKRNSNIVKITVQELFPTPELTATPSKPIEGGPMDLKCETWLPPQKSYIQLQFCFFREGRILGAGWSSFPEFQIPTMWIQLSGSYRCEAQAVIPYIQKWSQRIQVHVQRIPVSGVLMETQPPEEQVVEGKKLVLICSVTKGTGDITFSWYKDSNKGEVRRTSQRSQKAEMEISVVGKHHAGGYYCTANNGYGSISSTRVNITVRVPVSHSVLTLRAPRAQPVVGDVVEFHCEAQGGSPPVLYWFYHEDAILGNRSAPSGGGTSFNLSLTAEHSGNYFCEANNGLGAQRSHTVSLSVTEPPEDKSHLLAAGVTGGLLGFLVAAALLYVWFQRKSGSIPSSQKQTYSNLPAPTKELEPVYTNVNPVCMDVVYSQVWSTHQRQKGEAEHPQTPPNSKDSSIIYTEVKKGQPPGASAEQR